MSLARRLLEVLQDRPLYEMSRTRKDLQKDIDSVEPVLIDHIIKLLAYDTYPGVQQKWMLSIKHSIWTIVRQRMASPRQIDLPWLQAQIAGNLPYLEKVVSALVDDGETLEAGTTRNTRKAVDIARIAQSVIQKDLCPYLLQCLGQKTPQVDDVWTLRKLFRSWFSGHDIQVPASLDDKD